MPNAMNACVSTDDFCFYFFMKFRQARKRYDRIELEWRQLNERNERWKRRTKQKYFNTNPLSCLCIYWSGGRRRCVNNNVCIWQFRFWSSDKFEGAMTPCKLVPCLSTNASSQRDMNQRAEVPSLDPHLVGGRRVVSSVNTFFIHQCAALFTHYSFIIIKRKCQMSMISQKLRRLTHALPHSHAVRQRYGVRSRISRDDIGRVCIVSRSMWNEVAHE